MQNKIFNFLLQTNKNFSSYTSFDLFFLESATQNIEALMLPLLFVVTVIGSILLWLYILEFFFINYPFKLLNILYTSLYMAAFITFVISLILSDSFQIPFILCMEQAGDGQESSSPQNNGESDDNIRSPSEPGSPSSPQNNGESNENLGNTNNSTSPSNPQNNSEDDSNRDIFNYPDEPLHRTAEEMERIMPSQDSDSDSYSFHVEGSNNNVNTNTDNVEAAYIKGNNNNVTLGNQSDSYKGPAYIQGDNNTIHCGGFSPSVNGNNNHIILGNENTVDLAGHNNRIEGGYIKIDQVSGSNNKHINGSIE